MSLDGHLDVAVGGDTVEFTFTVTNVDTEPVDLSFRSGKVADVAVYADGAEVWRWSEGRMFTQALDAETLAPGDSFRHGATWPDPQPGEYVAEATLDATNVALSERASFEVE
ncbi:MAG: BsuPI-related putative proteinase inhibitor [Haloarculaceae archaeon]